MLDCTARNPRPAPMRMNRSHPDFERSDGKPINRPFLQLQAFPPNNDHIGLGGVKCRALCEVKEELKRWLQKQGVTD